MGSTIILRLWALCQILTWAAAEPRKGELTSARTADDIREFLEAYNATATRLVSDVIDLEWAEQTGGAGPADDSTLVQRMAQLAQFRQNMSRSSDQFSGRVDVALEEQRELSEMKKLREDSLTDVEQYQTLKVIEVSWARMYSSARRCHTNLTCWNSDVAEPSSRQDHSDSRLLAQWEAWHDHLSPKIRDKFEDYVFLMNRAYQTSGYKDAGEGWRSDFATETLEQDVLRLYYQILPLYEQLHGFARSKLKKHYGENSFPKTGQIPAHFLGQTWERNWNKIFNQLIVSPEVNVIDTITQNMINKNFTHETLFRLAEDFYSSVGLHNMTSSFWIKSVLEKPRDDRHADCEPSAWDFHSPGDYRIKMCTEITHDDLLKAHQVMGKVEVYMSYQHLRLPVRNEAFPGLAEAIGGLISLSVQTTDYLERIHLVEGIQSNEETELQLLISTALDLVAEIPHDYVVDLWRWSVFDGHTSPPSYNNEWWELKCRLQGVSSPLPRGANKFDPGADYYIATNRPGAGHFIGNILAFQLHKGLCESFGHKGPLHRCNLYGRNGTTTSLKSILQLGRLKSWQEVLSEITGKSNIDASALLEYFQPLFDFLQRENSNDYGWDSTCPSEEINLKPSVNSTDVDRVKQFIKGLETDLIKAKHEYAEAVWNLEVNATDYAREIMLNKSLLLERFLKEKAAEAAIYISSNLTKDLSEHLKAVIFLSKASQEYITTSKQLQKIESEMESVLSSAKVCLEKDKCLEMTPGLETLMATSKDYDKLLAVWTGWRDATGRKLKPLYPEYVELSKTAYQARGGSDLESFWHASFGTSLEDDLLNLLVQIQPLYEQLHGYARQRLMLHYGKDRFPTSGHIPAHLLGNMWAQSWDALSDIMLPFPDILMANTTAELIRQNYTISDIAHAAEDFFTSLGLKPMTKYFWNLSELTKPTDGRKFLCQPKASDMFQKNDFRIRMCAGVDEPSMLSLHREIGQVQYYMHNEYQPAVFRSSDNNVFSQIFGDVVTLSVQTKEHLRKIGLLNQVSNENETDLNILMDMALNEVVPLPYNFLSDLWQWSVFQGNTQPKNYNTRWWELRCRHQGISPPVPRHASDFDPGAKQNVPGDRTNIWYFLRTIIVYQIHKAACDTAGHKGPLYKCDIRGSRAAGDKFRKFLHLGSSHCWPDALEIMTGQRRVDISAMLDYFHPLYQFLKNKNKNSYGWDPLCPKFDEDDDPDEGKEFNQSEVEVAQRFIEGVNSESLNNQHIAALYSWNLKTNYTSHNQDVLANFQIKISDYSRKIAFEGKKFNITRLPYDLARQLESITTLGSNAQKNKTKVARLSHLRSNIEKIYVTSKVCLSNGNCLALDPDITNLMAKSRNYSELLTVWTLWRDVTGPRMKDMYSEHIDLLNEAMRLAGRKDLKDSWLKEYESKTFEGDVANLLAEIHPLYEQLHAYVRRRLKAFYGEDKFPSSGHIPAHILGNVWAQQWGNILPLVTPFPNKSPVDVTAEMIKQNYTVEQMIKLAESFFVSLGFKNMTRLFWTKSEFVKPKDGRAFACHPSAHNLYAPGDFRMKMCAEVNSDFLITTHHEMGHIQYYMEYERLPFLYRGGANDGFHEAVGDVMSLSVQTPEHLHKIKLTDKVSNDNESDINFLMKMALSKVAFLPFGYLIDIWRWSVFTGDTKPDNYTQHWWNLRCRYQGIFSPVKRRTTDFDPGAKNHVATDTPYMRYFVSFIIQFQFHKAACDAAGYKGPLHRCDIYGSRAAGEKIRRMLRMGESRPWQLAMKALTGQKKMDATPLMSYFKPLMDYLKKENGNDYGWDPHCPISELVPDITDKIIAM